MRAGIEGSDRLVEVAKETRVESRTERGRDKKSWRGEEAREGQQKGERRKTKQRPTLILVI
jgi:hypothetical protein